MLRARAVTGRPVADHLFSLRRLLRCQTTNDWKRPILLKNSGSRISSGFSSHQRRGECVALDFLSREQQFEVPLRAKLFVIWKHRLEASSFSTE